MLVCAVSHWRWEVHCVRSAEVMVHGWAACAASVRGALPQPWGVHGVLQARTRRSQACFRCQQPSPCHGRFALPTLGQAFAEQHLDCTEGPASGVKGKDWWPCSTLPGGPGRVTDALQAQQHRAAAQGGSSILRGPCALSVTGVPDWEGPRELCQTPFSPPDLSKRGPNFRWPNSGEVPDSVASLRKEWLLLTLAGCFLLSDFVGNIGCTLSTAAVCWCAGLGAASAMPTSVE